MVNAASSAVSVTVRLPRAGVASEGCAGAREESTIDRRKRGLMRYLSLRQAVSDVGVEGVLRSRTAAGGSSSAGDPEEGRTDNTAARVSAGVVRFAHALGDVGVEGVLRSRTAAGGSSSAGDPEEGRTDNTAARVSAGVVRFAHA